MRLKHSNGAGVLPAISPGVNRENRASIHPNTRRKRSMLLATPSSAGALPSNSSDT